MAIQINGRKVIQLGTANIPVLKGEKGDIGQQGEQGIQGIPGYTPVKGVDYMTSEDREQIADTVKADITPEITELKNGKVDKENGKGLSTNDFTNELKAKLDNAGKQEDIDKLKAENQKQAEEIKALDKTLTRAEASGENINIKNSAEYPISNISIDTNIKQDSREGYNLVDFINTKTYTNNNVGIVNKDLDNNLFKYTPSSATQWQGFYFHLLQNFEVRKVYLSFKAKGDNATKIRVGLTGILTNYKDLSITSNYVQYDLEFPLTEAGKVSINFYNWNTDDVVPFYIKDVQVTINEPKPYEQYGSMPSIEFPSEIKTPVGKQSLVVGNKNLFDKDNANVVNMYLDTNTGKAMTNGASRSILLPCKPNTTYTIYKSNEIEDILMAGTFETTPNHLDIPTTYTQAYGKTSTTITSGKNDSILMVYLCWGETEIVRLSEILNTVQVEIGDTATPYTPHQHQTQDLDVGELLGTIVDKEDGSYFENRWVKDIEDGTKGFNLSTTNDNFIQFISVRDGKNYSNALCNKLPFINTSDRVNKSGIVKYDDNNLRISLLKKDFPDITSVELFINFLKENNLEIYSLLETPTYTKLTETQQAQWNKIKKMHTYEGVTNIYTINENGISPVINMKYVKSPKVVEENLQAQIDKINSAIVALGAV